MDTNIQYAIQNYNVSSNKQSFIALFLRLFKTTMPFVNRINQNNAYLHRQYMLDTYQLERITKWLMQVFCHRRFCMKKDMKNAHSKRKKEQFLIAKNGTKSHQLKIYI